MGHGSTLLRISPAIGHGLHDVEVLKDVVHAAVVGKTIEEFANGLLYLHAVLLGGRCTPSIAGESMTTAVSPQA